MLYLILIISLSYLHAVDNDLEKGIVYLEKDKITNFDPYNLHYNLNTLNKRIDQETIDANNRMSVFLHETLFEHEDTQFKLNFIPKNKFFDNRKIENKSELIITMNPSEIFWKFHDDTYVTIEDIYYSILYAIKTNKNLPEFYNTSVDVIKKFDQNQIIIRYKNKYTDETLTRHFKDLIILPYEYTNNFVDGKEDIPKDYYRYKDQKDITNIVSAGPFRTDPDQNVSEESTKLSWFDGYENMSNQENPVELVKIKRYNLKTNWWNYLVNEKVNIVIDLLDADGQHEDIAISDAPSFKVTSLIVNHKNQFLSKKENRKMIAYMLDREKKNLIESNLNKKARPIVGPVSSNDSAYDTRVKYNTNWSNPDDIELFKQKFEKNLNAQGYYKEINKDYNTAIYKHKNTEEWLKFNILFNNAQGILSKKDQDVVASLVSIFINNGIILEKTIAQTSPNFRSYRQKMDFDFIYSIENMNSEDGLQSCYGIKVDNNGNIITNSNNEPIFAAKNYGKYTPSPSILQDLHITQKSFYDKDELLDAKKRLYRSLSEDYANIYLWSPKTIYGYNAKYIDVEEGWVVAGDFFKMPHILWEMVE